MHIYIYSKVYLHIYIYLHITYLNIPNVRDFMFLSGVFPNRAGPISAGQVVVVAMSTCAGLLLRTAKKQAVLVVSDFLFYLHSPSLIWNLNMMVSKFGISYSFRGPPIFR